MTYSIVAGPAHGTLSGTAPNVTYTPNAGYSGPDSFTFKASDGALDSNIATVSITVNPPAVVYNFSGFFQPVDNLPLFNSVSAGRAVPVRFGLGGYFGLNIFAAGYPASKQIKCDTAAPVDVVEDHEAKRHDKRKPGRPATDEIVVHQGTRTVAPIVRRDSSARWACAASASSAP